MKDESVAMLIERFDQRRLAFILHPSAFILTLVSPAFVVLKAF